MRTLENAIGTPAACPDDRHNKLRTTLNQQLPFYQNTHRNKPKWLTQSDLSVIAPVTRAQMNQTSSGKTVTATPMHAMRWYLVRQSEMTGTMAARNPATSEYAMTSRPMDSNVDPNLVRTINSIMYRQKGTTIVTPPTSATNRILVIAD